MAILLVFGGGDAAFGFVKAPELDGFSFGQGFAVHQDFVFLGDVEGGAVDCLAIDGDAAGCDKTLCLAARANAGAGNGLGNAHGRVWFGLV